MPRDGGVEPEPDHHLVVVHKSGARGKKVLDTLRGSGARVVDAPAVKTDRDKTEFATRRVIAALLDDGRAIELVADGFALTKLADAMRPSSTWTVRGAAKIEQGKMNVRPAELIAVGGPKPEGGDGVRSDSPWPEAAAG